MTRWFCLTAWGALLAGACCGAHSASFECLITPSQVIEVRSPVEGLIERVAVQRGDLIRKGQPLVELQSAAERAAVDAARYRAQMEGRIASARNRLEFAEKKLKRQDELKESNFIAAQSRDEAEVEKRLAESELADAVENRELARIEFRRAEELLALRRLQSPIAGVVTERLLNPGDIAEAGTGRKAILKIAQIDPLYVEVMLPLELQGKLAPGQRGEVTAEGLAGKHVATVTVVDRVFDAASATFGLRLELPNGAGRLPAGLRCQVEFPQVGARDGPGRKRAAH